MNRLWILPAGLAVMAGCSAPVQPAEPAPVVTVTAEPAPADQADATPFWRQTLNLAWRQYSRPDREAMCAGYLIAPDQMWDSFNNGADGSITRAQFTVFFNGKCGAA